MESASAGSELHSNSFIFSGFALQCAALARLYVGAQGQVVGAGHEPHEAVFLLRNNGAAWLLDVKHAEAATIFAFLGLSARAVLAVLHNVLALAFFTGAVFNYHSACF